MYILNLFYSLVNVINRVHGACSVRLPLKVYDKMAEWKT